MKTNTISKDQYLEALQKGNVLQKYGFQFLDVWQSLTNQVVTATELSQMLNTNGVAPINKRIGNIGNNIAEYLKINELDEEGKPLKAWRIVASGEDNEYFEWTMHEALNKAFIEFKEDIYRKHELWNQFLNDWPIERLHSMSIHEYTGIGDKTTFTNFLEFGSIELGSIKGGSSFKFGVYKRGNTEDKDEGDRYGYTDEYAWAKKYGDSPEEAFSKVKQMVIGIAEASRRGDYALIDDIDIGDAVKWKIAFLYQPQDQLGLTCIFSSNFLKAALGLKRAKKFSELNQQIMAKREDRDIFEFSQAMWSKAKKEIKASDIAKVASNDDHSDGHALNELMEGQLIMQPLNQILYGPPGTGKTYNTINVALSILEPMLDVENTDRQTLKAKFDDYMGIGRIHFVTFHQSFSYEDFVEGIKASSDGGLVSYTVESGIFKRACEAASKAIGEPSVDELVNSFAEMVSENRLKLTTPRGKAFWVSYKGNTTFTCEPEASEKNIELAASIEYVKQVLRGVRPEKIYCESYVNGIVEYIKNNAGVSYLKGDLVFKVGQSFNGYEVIYVSSDILTLRKPRGNILPFPMSILIELKQLVDSKRITVDDIASKGWQSIETTIEPYLVNGYSNLVPLLVKHLLDHKVNSRSVRANNSEPVVLIIDEINRGNISSIFGELITLIEPSKRAGADEQLTVTLPYSKEPFQVPNNLHLLGTMNTADRSLALMDTALRRRFDFVEMMPDSNKLSNVVIQGIAIDDMLQRMNQRIEVLYDREHTLGHAFFMSLKDDKKTDIQKFEELKLIFRNKILPLLEEYFFEDWEKIRLVLADNQTDSSEYQFIFAEEPESAESLFNSDEDAYSFDMKAYSRNYEALNHPDTFKKIYAKI